MQHTHNIEIFVLWRKYIIVGYTAIGHTVDYYVLMVYGVIISNPTHLKFRTKVWYGKDTWAAHSYPIFGNLALRWLKFLHSRSMMWGVNLQVERSLNECKFVSFIGCKCLFIGQCPVSTYVVNLVFYNNYSGYNFSICIQLDYNTVQLGNY